ncbi:hypothetical protein SAMN05444007_101283 [Cribrihabitans marinus]|uniref:EamA-like transporter family protein n=1 Tax=Cribrihabitans marinus TaxID=1227549 RepID=A0A1H6QT43_9RHOB|nr:DMT family transporter [Cribrihabitans marinus]GGH19780.1 hypothetical protein GCM10010973_03290 [Cribrihabitans marinus]SEI46723.1 hypothetical protein SAMN05444007_101283 [Cribrihabitans marinus]
MNPVLAGVALVVAYTGLISAADTITKLIAGGYAAAQLFALSGAGVAAMCLVGGQGLRTSCPRAMALRSAATVLAAICFFYGFRDLPLAEMFLFIGLMPILAALMSGPVLNEAVRPTAWIAMLAGFTGVLALFPGGLQAIGVGHLWALAATGVGTVSMVLARYIGRHERNALAQVFYPNLALAITMGVALPFVWRPMPAADLSLVALYALLLFGARWLVVIALRCLAAHVVLPLMGLQFFWMAGFGAWVFGQWPSAQTLLGTAMVIGSGLVLVWDEIAPRAGTARLRTDP